MIAHLRQRYAEPHEPLRSERRVELVVVFLALVVVLQLLVLLGRYLATSQVRALPPAPDSLTVVSRIQPRTPTPQQSLEVLSRPVFFPSRRPPEPPPDGALAGAPRDEEKKAGSLKGLKVLGIVENGNESRVIVSFRGEQQRLLKNDSVAGWRLTEVTPRRVVLESGDQRDERSLTPAPVIAVSSGSSPVSGPDGDTAGNVGDARAGAAARARQATEARQKPEQPVNARRTLSAGGAPTGRQAGNKTQ